MSGPKAFSMRRAISGVSAALPWRRSESVARRTCRISAAFDTVRPRASMTSVLIRSPGWGGFFMGISRLSVIVDQINVAGGVRPFVVPENQPPVSGNSQAPRSFPVALQRMQSPSGKAAKLLQRLGGFEGEQKLAQLIGHRGRHALGASLLVELS